MPVIAVLINGVLQMTCGHDLNTINHVHACKPLRLKAQSTGVIRSLGMSDGVAVRSEQQAYLCMEIARKADNAQPYNFRSAEPLTTQQSSKKKDKKTRNQEDAICRYALHHDVLIGEVWYPHIFWYGRVGDIFQQAFRQVMHKAQKSHQKKS